MKNDSNGEVVGSNQHPHIRRVRYANPDDAKRFELTVIEDRGPHMEAEDLAEGDYIEPAVPDTAEELARVTAERDALLLWKQWTIARELTLRASKSLDLAERQRASQWHFAMTTYGLRLRRMRSNADITMADVRDKLGISVERLSGVELGREPPFNEETNARLCKLITADESSLLGSAMDAFDAMAELAGNVKP